MDQSVRVSSISRPRSSMPANRPLRIPPGKLHRHRRARRQRQPAPGIAHAIKPLAPRQKGQPLRHAVGQTAGRSRGDQPFTPRLARLAVRVPPVPARWRYSGHADGHGLLVVRQRPPFQQDAASLAPSTSRSFGHFSRRSSRGAQAAHHLGQRDPGDEAELGRILDRTGRDQQQRGVEIAERRRPFPAMRPLPGALLVRQDPGACWPRPAGPDRAPADWWNRPFPASPARSRQRRLIAKTHDMSI
jgi:hypothetical protein